MTTAIASVTRKPFVLKQKSRAFAAKFGNCGSCGQAFNTMIEPIDMVCFVAEISGSPVHADGCPVVSEKTINPLVVVSAGESKTLQGIPASVRKGKFTVVLEDGSHKTFSIVTKGKQSKYDGQTWIGVLTGSNNDSDYTYFGNVHGSRIVSFPTKGWRVSNFNTGIAYDGMTVAGWVILAEALLAGDYKAAGALYAQESGNCYRCNRTLTVPSSIDRGLGIDCASKSF